MTCEKCNTEIDPGAAFCQSCGTPAPAPDPEGATVAMQSPPGQPFDVDETAEIITPLEDPLLLKVREEMSADYEVEKELGRGGMAIVFRGIERELHRPVAIKILPPDATGTGAGADRFKREARLAASLDHPNVVPVYRVGQAGEYFYMAMKFVEGLALDAIFNNQGPLPIPVVLKLLRDSANGLAFAHEKGIIHRDIKGGNILIDTDGRVMVADFGIARSVTDDTLTATGMVVGTPHYMSPEQCSGAKVGPQSDQYSLGILAFELLTGTRPFDADTIMAIIQHHYMTPPPDIKLARDDVPDALVAIINRCLAKKPDGRFADTSQLVDALDAVPQTSEDRRLSREMLKALAKGEKADNVEVAELPPLPTSIDSGPGGFVPGTAMQPQRETRKKSKAPAVLATVIGVAAVGAGLAWQQGMFSPPAPANVPAETASPAASQAPTPEGAPGALRFTGLPAGASVKVGNVTLTGGRGTVPAGDHIYEITAPGFQTIAQRVTVVAGETQTLPVVMVPIQATLDQQTQANRPTPRVTYGNLTVAANPVQARILLDGQEIATGRVVGHRVTAGRHRLRVELSGYAPFDTTINVGTNATVRVTGVRLQPGNE